MRLDGFVEEQVETALGLRDGKAVGPVAPRVQRLARAWNAELAAAMPHNYKLLGAFCTHAAAMAPNACQLCCDGSSL